MTSHVDGIINPELFAKEQIKILFIGKEPNKSNHNVAEGETVSFIDEWCNRKPNYQFAQRIAELAYGIFTNFRNHDEISGEDKKEIRYGILKRIAFLNIKKESGKDTISDKELSAAATKNKPVIDEQIKNIKPNVIIIFVSNNKIVEQLFNNIKFKPSGFGCLYGETCDFRILQMYHPSVRIGSAALYSLLKVNFEKLGWVS
ncbi:MAG: hypothetical protein IPJ66_10530 [Bacteroidetes bacterium]|nr:hypothetical protein [Bacteroidota bacterium]